MLLGATPGADRVAVHWMTPHNWHNFLRCHGPLDEVVPVPVEVEVAVPA
jgi:hypothetical protein